MHLIGWVFFSFPPGPAVCFVLSFFIPQLVARTSRSRSAPLCFYREPAAEGLIVRITINLRSDPTSLGEAAWLYWTGLLWYSSLILSGERAAGQQERRCFGATRGPNSQHDECMFLLGFNQASQKNCTSAAFTLVNESSCYLLCFKCATYKDGIALL